MTNKTLVRFLKWFLINTIIFINIVFIIVVIFINMNTKEKLINFKDKDIYKDNKEQVFNWFEISTVRGEVFDIYNSSNLYLINMYLAYSQEGANLSLAELENKKFLLKDIIMTWFSQKSKEFLVDTKNRTLIRYSLIDKINEVLVYPIKDIRFTNFQIHAL